MTAAAPGVSLKMTLRSKRCHSVTKSAVRIFFPTTMTYLCECVGMYVCVVCVRLYVRAGTHVRVCACVGARVRPSVRVCVLVRMYIGVFVTTI